MMALKLSVNLPSGPIQSVLLTSRFLVIHTFLFLCISNILVENWTRVENIAVTLDCLFFFFLQVIDFVVVVLVTCLDLNWNL